MEQTATSADVCIGDHEAEYPRLLKLMQRRAYELTAHSAPAVFKTDAPALFELYLNALPGDRQYHTCNACRHFIQRFGSLVTIDAQGSQHAALWPDAIHDGEYPYYADAINAVRSAVERAKVIDVHHSAETVWGTPETGPWSHFAITAPLHLVHKGRIVQTGQPETPYQATAERRQDYQTMIKALQEFSIETIDSAVALLRTDALYRSEKCLGAAEWLRDVMTDRNATKDSRRRANLLWRAVATAPVGYAHPRSSMIGTLLEDIHAGLPTADVQAKFAAKMHPLQYQRPQALPSAGAIAQAEKIVVGMGIEPSLRRRFARNGELQTVWTPRATETPKSSSGVFADLKAKDKLPHAADPHVRATAITWEKFARTILPDAERIEMLMPRIGGFCAFLTAADQDAPPIIQWDNPEKRNPVTWFVYHGGSEPARWSLSAGSWVAVNAISLQPNMWQEGFGRHGAGALFVLEGARHNNFPTGGNCLFPEFLRSELHQVRSVIEAHSKRSTIEGADLGSACGLIFQKQRSSRPSDVIRVHMRGASADYTLDRWD